MFQRTPTTVNADVENLCARLDKKSKPVFLDVEKKQHSVELDCYGNVAKQIEKEGGRVQYGWQLWEWPGVMIQAEFHAVWVDTDGKLHDLTPKQVERIHTILFLPDTSRIYEGRQVDNVRLALQDDPLIDEFIDNEQKAFQAMNRGDLASSSYFILTPELRGLVIRNDELIALIGAKYPLENYL